MDKKVVFLILDYFADWEGAYLASMLMDKEISVENQVWWASIDKKPKKSIGHMTILPDMSLEEIPEDIDALILIGGFSWRSEDAKKVVPIVRKFKTLGTILGFICDATYFAATEGFLNDVNHTGNNPAEMKNTNVYTNPDGFIMENAVTDGNIVTANGNSPVEFATSVLKALDFLPEEEVNMLGDFYLIGYWNALKKYGYLD